MSEARASELEAQAEAWLGNAVELMAFVEEAAFLFADEERSRRAQVASACCAIAAECRAQAEMATKRAAREEMKCVEDAHAARLAAAQRKAKP